MAQFAGAAQQIHRRRQTVPLTMRVLLVLMTVTVPAVLYATDCAAQVTRLGFLPESSPELGEAPHEPPFIFAAHGLRNGANLTTLRADLWSKGVGLALAAEYFDNTTGSGSGALSAAFLARLRKQHTKLSGFGVQAQFGASLINSPAGTIWNAPASLGLFLNAPVPAPVLGRLTARPWIAGFARLREQAATTPGLTVGLWLIFNQRDWRQGWGLVAAHEWAFSHGENVLDLGISRILQDD